MIKLSIVIPCYNAEPYVYELLECLNVQITDEVEVILIDDGSKKPVKADYKWLKVLRQDNGGISKARNRGLELSKSEFVWFLDADDLITENAIEYILNKLSEKDCDYMDLSWKSLEDNRYMFKLNSDNDSLPNPSASTRIFKRSFIGYVRFPEKKDAAEDEDFTRHLQIRKAKHICATEFIYLYRVTTPGSNYKRYMEGKTKTKRIGYYYKYVTADMTDLLEEIKETEQIHEVFLFTYRNDIPELEKYCNISEPKPMRVAEKRGEPNTFFTLIPKSMETQLVVYTSVTSDIGGIETWIYNFCKQMHELYDIVVLYDSIATRQLVRLSKMVRCIKNNPANPIICDTLIMSRLADAKPSNVEAKRSIQIVHCRKTSPERRIPNDRDIIINVSQASKDSFGAECDGSKVIHNMTSTDKPSQALLLVSALRIGANDKLGADERCRRFAKLLDDAKINYLWLYFGDKQLTGEPVNMHYMGIQTDIRPFVAKADWLVQLSGSEAFSYSMLEALTVNTPIICTDLDQNAEMGINDGINAYILPLDFAEIEPKRVQKPPKFKFKYDNKPIIEEWRTILGNTTPKGDYNADDSLMVRISRQYYDLQLEKVLDAGMRLEMSFERAMELKDKGFVEILG